LVKKAMTAKGERKQKETEKQYPVYALSGRVVNKRRMKEKGIGSSNADRRKGEKKQVGKATNSGEKRQPGTERGLK